MKKIFLLLTIITMVFTSCDPLEDIHTEIDAQDNAIVGDTEYTLIDDDYDALELYSGTFSTVEEAREMIPGLLTEMFPAWGNNSSAAVTFLVSGLVDKYDYTVSAGDYTEIGLNSLLSSDDFDAFFAYKFPSVEKGTVVNLTFKSNPDIVDYELTTADYDLVGNTYGNFDIRTGKDEETIEARRIKIETILLNNSPDGTVGDIYKVTYKGFNNDYDVVTLDMEVVLTAGTAGVTNYTLTDADFDLVGNGQYNNFDIRAGKDEETIEARRAKIETILLNNFPSAVDGDIYNVTYAVYEGFASTRTTAVIKNGASYDLFTDFDPPTYQLYTFAFVDNTSTFVYTGNWEAPYILTTEDYIALGHNDDDLEGRNVEQRLESARLLEVYLGNLYPYAAEGDFMAVQYNSYEGSGVTAIENVNFTFDGSKWNGITDMTIQFGHDGTTWVPDNTIKYTLIRNADYEYMASQLTDAEYAGLIGNLAKYGDFDYNWTDEQIHYALILFLDNYDSSAEEGQKYLLTYVIYDNGENEYSTRFIKTGGAWVLNE
jgi:hypothetical protein